MAKRNGARLVIINRDPTEFDDIADLVVRHDIGAVLEPFIAHAVANAVAAQQLSTPLCTVSHSLSVFLQLALCAHCRDVMFDDSGDS